MTINFNKDFFKAMLDEVARPLPHDKMMYVDEDGICLRWDEMKIHRTTDERIELEFCWRGEFVCRQQLDPPLKPGGVLHLTGITGMVRVVLGDE